MKLTLVFTLFLVLVGAMMTSAAARNCLCTDQYAPVCGTNGVTYSNQCRLNCARAKLAYVGECGSNI